MKRLLFFVAFSLFACESDCITCHPKLKKLYKEYFNASGKHDKKYYREKIEKLEWALIEETLIESGNKNAHPS